MSERIIPVHQEEGSKKKSLDIWEFIGKLEWLKDAELENTKPFDVSKLRTPHILFILTQGVKYALSLHFTIFLTGFLVVIFSFFFPYFYYFSYPLELLLLLIKIGFPVWLIRKFVIWENSLMTKIIENFVIGYAVASFAVDVLSAVFSVGLFVFFEILKQYENTRKVAEVGLMFFNLKSVVVWSVNSVIDFSPLVYFYIYKKKKRFNAPRWIPLDEVPRS